MRKLFLSVIICLLVPFLTKAQQPTKPNASEVYEAIKKLKSSGDVFPRSIHILFVPGIRKSLLI